MPGQDETQVENQEPTSQENEEEEQEESAEKYEDRIEAMIVGVTKHEESS